MTRTMRKLLIILAAVGAFSNISVFADTPAKPLNLRAETNTVNMDMVIKDNFVKAKFASAENRFLQGNVKASHDDFADLVSRAVHDDYVFLVYGIKMAEYGFFDLSEQLFKRLDANTFTANYVKDIKKYYYPSGMVEPKDLIYYADAYSSIVYNNMAIETTSELLNNSNATESDYKNYLIALGFYKSNNLQQALKYINNAIVQNDNNTNYKILKAKILADSNKPKQAVKMLKEINKTEFLTIDFQDKIRAVNEYVEYKIAKDEPLKDYHLSYYYHLQGKSLLATKVLQASILQAKQYAPQIFALLSRIYYECDEPLKAQEFAQRAFKEDKNQYLAVLTLADINYDERKYEDALKYYKSAKKLSKENEASIGIAKTYLAMENTKKSKKLYEKLLKKEHLDEDLLVNSLKVFPQRADDYLARVASVDISNNEIWLGLAGLALKDGNVSMAETFLNNSYYIDENNFKYYYYLSLVLRAKGNIEQSNQSLIRCSRLDSDYASKVNLD